MEEGKSVIINPNINQGILREFQFTHIRYGKNLKADLILSDCLPALAIIFLFQADMTTMETLNDCRLKIHETQDMFKNSLAIVIGFEDPTLWNMFQSTIQGKNLRICQTNTISKAIAISKTYYESMKDKGKILAQSGHFENEKKMIESRSNAQLIIRSLFQFTLHIPEDDTKILMDGFSSIYELATTTQEEMEYNSPANSTSIAKNCMFFDKNTTSINK
eukprot:gene10858-14575_t